MEQDEPQVKGLSIVHWLASFEHHYGAKAQAALIAAQSDDAAAAMRGGLRTDRWYPLAWFRSLLSGARAQTDGGLDIIAKLARTSAMAEFTGIHRVLLLFVSPQRLLRISKRVFDRYYTNGCIESIARGNRGAEVRWVGCCGFDENVWHDAIVAATVAVELCGARKVQWAFVEGGGDDDHATVDFRWQ